MAEFNEEQLKRISFHLLTFKNPKARQHVLRNQDQGRRFFPAWNRGSCELTGLFPEEIKAVRERNWAAAEKEVGAAGEESTSRSFSAMTTIIRRCWPKSMIRPTSFISPATARLLAKTKLAVVGSRRGSAYGQSALNRILPECCRAGLVIVSGMAYRHRLHGPPLALRENGGTIGVNAGGLLHLNPPGNPALISKIIERGGRHQRISP